MKAYERYSDSGISWIGKIPDSWSIVKLKRIVDMKSGNFISADVIEDNGKYPVYGGNGVRGYHSEFTHDGYFPLIGRQGALCGNVNYANGKFWPTEHAVVVSSKKDVDLLFVGEMLRLMNLNQYSQASAQPGLSVEKVINLPIPLPSTDEQRKISRFILHQTNIIDELIAKKEKLIEKLKEKRQAVINEAVTKGLDPNAKMKDSGIEWLREIPEEWRVVALGYLALKVGSGVTPKGGAESYVEEGITFIRSQNVHFGGLKLDDVVKIDADTHAKMSGSKVQLHDVLLNITGASIGRCCVVDASGEMNVNQHVCIIRLNDRIDYKFLNLVLQSDVGQTQIKLGTTGGNREGLTFEAIKEFEVPLPPKETQHSIVLHVENLLMTIEHLGELNKIQIEKLKEYRQSLISEAVTGKIDVRGWEPPGKN